MNHEEILKQLKGFLTINPYGRGILQKANILLLSTFPEYFIPESVLKNVLLKLREVKDDTESLLNDLMERNGKSIEFMKTNRDADTGVLDFMAWCFKGSKNVVLRCTEPVFWDATHNTTRYEYKLSSFTAIDSEGKSRCVMMCSMLRERKKISYFCCIVGRKHLTHFFHLYFSLMKIVQWVQR